MNRTVLKDGASPGLGLSWRMFNSVVQGRRDSLERWWCVVHVRTIVKGFIMLWIGAKDGRHYDCSESRLELVSLDRRSISVPPHTSVDIVSNSAVYRTTRR
jgi:hypothetical protein